MSVLGRESFLAPVHWTPDGWPVVGRDHHVGLEMEAPGLKLFNVKAPKPKTLFTGRTTWPRMASYPQL